jgi:signal transduction histidine kinase
MSALLKRNGEPLLAAAFVLAGVAETLPRDIPRAPLVIAVGSLAAASLAWRVRLPLVVLVVNLGASVALELLTGPDDYPVAYGLALIVAIYSAAAHTLDREETAVGAALVASVPVLAFAHSFDYDLHDPSGRTNTFIGTIFLIISFRVAWLVGKWVQRRQLSRERAAHDAVRAERARIAHELHDVLAHAISVIVLQSRGARHALGDRPDEARDAIDAIERTAAQALAELRRLLGILHTDDYLLTPQPSLAHIGRLVDEVSAAGLPVTVRIEGEERELPPGVDLCAYRVVQEALTNSLRHAGPATAEVVLRYRDDALDLLVTDTGQGDSNGVSAGYGLAGMRERIALFGGSLESGNRVEGGYFVSVELPV